MAASLRCPDGHRHRRMEGAVRTARPAAQAVVVQLDDLDVAGQRHPHREVGPLDVAEVARVLDGDRPQRAAGGRELVPVLGQPLVDVEDPRAEPRRSIGAHQMPVVLQRRATAGRIDQDRRLAGHRRHHPLGQPGCLGLEAGVDVQRPATRPTGARQGDAGARRLDQPLGRRVDRPQPGIHDAPGEEPDVGARRGERLAAHRQRRQAQALRHQPRSLGQGERARAGQQQPMMGRGCGRRGAATTA